METHLIELDGTADGYFEIEREKSSAKIAIFGLLADSRGADWAATRSPRALDRAFEVGPRVWLTTCTLDGPNALPNYLSGDWRYSGRRNGRGPVEPERSSVRTGPRPVLPQRRMQRLPDL